MTELDSTLATNKFSTYFGGNNSEDESIPSSPGATAGIAVSSGTIYITGATNSTSGIPGIQGTYAGGTSDGFVAKIVP